MMTTIIRFVTATAGLVGWALVLTLFNRWTKPHADVALMLLAVLLVLCLLAATLAFAQEMYQRRKTAKAAAKWASKPSQRNRGR